LKFNEQLRLPKSLRVLEIYAAKEIVYEDGFDGLPTLESLIIERTKVVGLEQFSFRGLKKN